MQPSVPHTPAPPVRFGHFTLDPASGELFKRGHRVRLQDQPCQVLVCLLQRPGEIVTREELRRRLWPGETIVGFDEGLNSAIRRLRFALGDSADHPRFIETFPRRGYRFIGKIENGETGYGVDGGGRVEAAAPVPVAAPATTAALEAAASLRATATRPRRRWLAFAAAALLAGAAAWIGLDRLENRIAPGRGPGGAPLDAKLTQLTSAAGPERNPSLSPDGSQVVYVAEDGGDEDLFLQPIERHRAAINLTADCAFGDRQPAFSPDGRQIAFRSERNGGGIFVTDLAGTTVRRVAAFGNDPAWSPDGDQLVVATEGIEDPLNRRSTSQLWRIELATGRQHRLTTGDSVQPAWSPHGDRIAYWHIGRHGGQRDIDTIPAGGGEAVSVTVDAAMDWSPSWSDDGRHLYFASDRGGIMNLWRVAIDERSGRALGKPEAVTGPSRWSGDLSAGARGQGVVFTAKERRSNVERIAFDALRGAVVGSPASVTATTIPFVQPAVSRDGRWLVFRTEIEQEDLYVSRVDGSGLRQLTADPARDRAGAWSPDGGRIAFYSDRGGTYEIWTIRPDGGGLQQLTDISSAWVSYPLWSSDGRQIMVNNDRGTHLFTVPPPGRLARELRALPPLPEDGRVFRGLAWSPDGKWVMGRRYGVDGQRIPGILVHSIERGTYHELAEFGDWSAWLSDSERLLFSDRGKLYLAHRDGGFRELASLSGQIQSLALAADDSTIYFTRSDDESDVWLVTLK
jgi:Tol biopolymer transport system component/DNA-binding winged helix-turn-helix (wHTH) protein